MVDQISMQKLSILSSPVDRAVGLEEWPTFSLNRKLSRVPISVTNSQANDLSSAFSKPQ